MINKTMSLHIKNIYLPDGKKTELHIDNGIITKVGECLEETTGHILDGGGKYVIPGFYNMHTHAAMTLLRGYRDDLKLFEWLQDIWAVEAHLDDEAVYWGVRLACLEMIKSGTICFADMYFRLDVTAKAISDSGLKAMLTSCMLDAGREWKVMKDREDCEQDYASASKWADSVKFGVAVHAPYTVCDKNILWAADFARERGLHINIHVSETEKENSDFVSIHGLSPVRYLDKLNFWGDDVILAHGLHLSDDDVSILGDHKVTVAHNINSNLKLASGYSFRYEELRDAGANVTIGTDGCASSNNLDMLEAMKTTSLLQKGWRRDPESLPLGELIKLSTLNGAKSMRVDGGQIKEGCAADLLLIDTHSPAFTPNINFLSNLVYSANSSCIDTVICNGNVLMEGRRVKDEDLIMEQASKHSARIISMVKK